MGIVDLYQSSEHRNNLAHFAAIVNLALVDGEFNEEEKARVEKYAHKLGISSEEYALILENPKKYPLNPPADVVRRMERMYDFFKIIYADHIIDDEECGLLERYAIGLGYTSEQSAEIIKKSVKIFGGNIDLEDYQYLINKK